VCVLFSFILIIVEKLMSDYEDELLDELDFDDDIDDAEEL
jgi:hypothetical protein